MILVENIVKIFKRFENLIKSLKNICLNLVTVSERRIYEVIWFVESFSNLRLNSSVAGLFIDF